MYRFGKADTAIELADGSGYKVMIYTDGHYVPMTTLVDGKWELCVFRTLREADRAMGDYNDFSWVD